MVICKYFKRVYKRLTIQENEDNTMIHDLMYIELKTGYSDDGPAWIEYVKTSKSKKPFILTTTPFKNLLVATPTI